MSDAKAVAAPVVIDMNAGRRTCPQCRRLDQPSMTLSERMTMVQACPFCAHEYQDSEIYRDEPAPPPIVHAAQVQASPLRSVARPAPSAPANLVQACRDRLADIDLTLAGYEGLKAEAKQLRKMIAAAERVRIVPTQLQLVTNK